MRKDGDRLFIRGFTLVELLVVMVILGLIMSSVYSLYITSTRTTASQEEVVDLQQNLRIVNEWMTRDLRMAGFMVSDLVGSPVNSATPTSVRINTASTVGRIAVVNQPFFAPLTMTNSVTVKIESSDMVDMFDTGTYNTVRIIRPPDHSQPINALFTVASKNRTAKTLDLKGFSDPGRKYMPGDVIVRTTASAPHPQTIEYALNGDSLERSVNGETPVSIAEGITALSLQYLKDDNSFVDTVTGTELGKIKAVKVLVSAQANTPDGMKSREVENLIAIRNR